MSSQRSSSQPDDVRRHEEALARLAREPRPRLRVDASAERPQQPGGVDGGRLDHARAGEERGVAEDRVDDRQDLEVLAVQALERAAGACVGRGRDEVPPELVDEEGRVLLVVEAEPHRVLPVEGAASCRRCACCPCRGGPARSGSCTSPDAALPVVLESGERPCLLADVALGVAAAGAEREELHQLARVVLVRRPLRVLRAREPEEHRRVPRDLRQHLVERAEREPSQELVLLQHQLLRADAGE